MRNTALLDELADDERARRVGETAQFVEGCADFAERAAAGVADEDGALGSLVLPGIVDGTASETGRRARPARSGRGRGAGPSLGPARNRVNAAKLRGGNRFAPRGA